MLKFHYYDLSEFQKFLATIPTQDAIKLLAVIERIEIYGLEIAQRQHWIRKLTPSLNEIRSRTGNNIQRAIYFHLVRKDYLITQAFTKKSQKTPYNEINKGEKRRSLFIHREEAHRHE